MTRRGTQSLSSSSSLDERFTILATPRFNIINVREGAPLCRHPGKVLVYVNVPCPYTREIVLKAFRGRAWCQMVSSANGADIQWADYEDLDWDTVLEGQSRANSYLVRKGLSRKAQLSYYITKYCKKNPQSILNSSVPEAVIVDTWEAFEEKMNFGLMGGGFAVASVPRKTKIDWCLADVRDKMESSQGHGLWIMKPSVTNKGAEVFVVKDFASLRENIHNWTDIREWVVQRYISNPLLFRRRKFHLRAYILAVGDLQVYFFDQVLLLSSGVDYVAHDITNQLAHITNTARQTEGDDFREEDCVFLLDDLVQELTMAPHGLSQDEASHRMAQIRQDMHHIIGELFRAMHGEPTVFAPLPHCFELYGVDFMIDDHYGVHLLEANPGPDFKQTGGRLKRVIQELIDTTMNIVFTQEDKDAATTTTSTQTAAAPLPVIDMGSFSKVYDEASHQVPGAKMRLF